MPRSLKMRSKIFHFFVKIRQNPVTNRLAPRFLLLLDSSVPVTDAVDFFQFFFVGFKCLGSLLVFVAHLLRMRSIFFHFFCWIQTNARSLKGAVEIFPFL